MMLDVWGSVTARLIQSIRSANSTFLIGRYAHLISYHFSPSKIGRYR